MRPTLVFAALFVCRSAQANDGATAEVLFHEGRDLMNEGNLAAACPKLEESFHIDASSGTLINVALCHEKQGRIAKAWGEYLEVGRIAKAQGKQARAEEAAKRANELAPKVPRIRINVAKSTEGLVVLRDGDVVGPGALGSHLPFDPGTHVIAARAEGHVEWKTSITIGIGEKRDVEVPPLEPLPVEVTPKVAPPEPAKVMQPPSKPQPVTPELPRSSSRGYWTVGVAAAAVASLAVGTAFGFVALSSYHAAESACPSHKGCAPSVADDYSHAQRDAWISTVALGVGIVGAGITTFLLVSAPSSEKPARVTTSIGLGTASLTVRF